jgi:hypothetical protein
MSNDIFLSKRRQSYFNFFYQVIHALGPVAYELVLPSDAWIHLVFHITKLKLYHGTPPTQITPLFSSLDEDQSPTLTVLGKSVMCSKQGRRYQLLIQWGGLIV